MKQQAFFFTVLPLALWGVSLCMSVSSCTPQGDQLETCVDSFAQSYFRWQFQRATSNCDTLSRRWLSYVASQVTQDDVDSLRNMKTDVKYTLGSTSLSNDSTAIVDVQVSHFLSMDSLGQVTIVEKQVTYGIPATFHDGYWRVSLREVPHPKAGD